MWRKHRDLFLHEMICLKGGCSQAGTQSCLGCNCPSPEYRCDDCLGSELYCSSCILLAHVRHPLHCLQKWNGQYFEKISLKTLGLHIQLGHTTDERCLNPHRAFKDDFVIIDTHGIHKVSLDFCDCAIAESHVQQLLRISWFPSTTSDPKTTATFHVLEQYHILLFESKVSMYKFYHALRQMSNNTGLLPVKISGTAEGECAILCPTCPHPGKNLPANWKDAPQQWLYGLFLMIDTNFRLKCKAVLNDNIDPSLSQGWGYFVEEEAYKGFLCSSADSIQEVSCYLVSAAGNLTWACRYINMDYLFFSTLCHTVLDTLNWHKKLWNRMSAFPLSMHLSHAIKTISFFMPKFHLPAHIEQCQTSFSFNFKSGVGRTNGEAPEHVWANINPVASNTLDDYFGDSNWKKVVGLGGSIFLAREDQVDLQTGTYLTLHKDCTPSVFISTGLELEEHQRQMKADRAGLRVHAMDNQEEKILQQSNTLRQRIDAWVKMQELYMPFLTALRVSEGSVSNNGPTAPEAIKLWLPSHISGTVHCDTHLQVIKWKLRYGQAHNALRSLHSNLRAQTAILKYKDRHLHGQGANTWARNTLKAVEVRIEAAARTYEHAHKSLVVLAPQVNQTQSGWHSSLRPLDRADICSMTDILWGELEGMRKLSWIWSIWGAAPNEMDKDNILEDIQIEWCKARAWAMYWAEEVELLKEEMQRIQQFFEWDVQRWDEWGLGNALQDTDQREGHMAYAKRQAILC
ncbi:uncharacterized protein EDB93DRAFT_1243611 [Suillus bovinus]|uniref:uncharacterized protein n=1 Tax=Suillus bovinus TaxID=48563 RepID=UPI001B86D574|nr:uncharacterized protein EDB93DRAFT_1243611 [Suillus bovinus]KAG2128024.1 hypothetical protein EDB93DRAFT_1243611 [Suillus bovinus]